MKTAMQEALIKLRQLRDDCDDYDYKSIYSLAIVTLNEYLEKEKEQIVNAYDRGYKACDLDEALEINKTMFSGERYYEQTFNQNK
jgi:hypothetical protein